MPIPTSLGRDGGSRNDTPARALLDHLDRGVLEREEDAHEVDAHDSLDLLRRRCIFARQCDPLLRGWYRDVPS